MISASTGPLPSAAEAFALADQTDIRSLMRRAAVLRDQGHGTTITYSRKVFIPLTHLCRDNCQYCTFARPPRKDEPAYMTAEEIMAIVRKGEAARCTEALFTLGDKPELRYRRAKAALQSLGH